MEKNTNIFIPKNESNCFDLVVVIRGLFTLLMYMMALLNGEFWKPVTTS